MRKLYACSRALVEELCDENRFAKNPMRPLERVRQLAGDGLFTAYHGEPNWQTAHDVLMPGFSYAGLRNYHGAMLDIGTQLIQRGVRYVQDRIAADADEVWELLGDPTKHTHVYVCGDGAQMAPAVRQAFIDIYRARAGSDESQARDWLIELVESDRYVEDVWAG
ncbi:hypothetical protein A5649_13815 [Mycolicibacter heraklionensis]|uniref:NADPH--hemoprotein reductase n=1 Tax=Mycolicibacter heraklionensis TaxID=512402 RepID=A0AA91EY60_9MYCO|nr:hypothetical protein [Mycolicibacter heraklionensis]OBK89124.1 hypothetical protein A5649_13815 [Mycolicibacter heraklionensis]